MKPFATQPSLARAFSLFANWDLQIAEQAAADLQQCLSGLSQSQRLRHSWRSSLLTGCRFPVEFAFSSLSDSAIRFCSEVDAPEVAPETRLDRALTLLARCNSPTLEQPLLALIKQIQHAGKLSFGTWLGARYSKNTRQFKLYFDLTSPTPRQAYTLLRQYFSHTETLDELAKLVMIGKVPGSDTIEFYFELYATSISHDNIVRLMTAVNLPQQAEQLIALLNEARQYSSSLQRQQLPSSTYGFSLALSATGEVTVFSLFTFADHLIGGDGEIRHAVLSMAKQHGWKLPFYEEFSEPLVTYPYRYEYHNIIGFSVTQQGKAGISISLAPPGELGDPPMLLQANAPVDVTIAKATRNKSDELMAKLLNSQAPSGAFTSFVTLDTGQTITDENAFVTAKVLAYLHTQTPTPALHSTCQRALDFLQRCEDRDKPGQYRFWPEDAHPQWMAGEKLPPDIDDTAMIACQLYLYHRLTATQLQHSASAICRYRLETVNKSRHPWQHSDCFNTWMAHNYQPNLTDCIVNVNALLLLHLAGNSNTLPYVKAAATVNDGLEWAGSSLSRLQQLTPYYANPSELYFALRYAETLGLNIFAESFSAFKSRWQNTIMTHYQTETPVYCREDGVIWWKAPALYFARKLFYQF